MKYENPWKNRWSSPLILFNHESLGMLQIDPDTAGLDPTSPASLASRSQHRLIIDASGWPRCRFQILYRLFSNLNLQESSHLWCSKTLKELEMSVSKASVLVAFPIHGDFLRSFPVCRLSVSVSVTRSRSQRWTVAWCSPSWWP